MKQIEVQIMGQGYVLGCPEGGEARLSEAVSRVDEAMCKIRDAGKIKARERIAVLAAINIAFDTISSSQPIQSTSQEDAKATSDTNAMFESLLKRLDEALAVDGQLL